MSRFYCVMNNATGSTQIDDLNISPETTYSSYQIHQLFNDLLGVLVGYAFLEYPSDIRASPQALFETPDSSKGVMWVLREGVKMTKDKDYTVVDSTHIKFVESVPTKYTVSIFLIGGKNNNIPPSLEKGETTDPNGGNTTSNPTVYNQVTTTTSWVVSHNKGFQYPNLTVVDEDDNDIKASVNIYYNDENNLTISSEIPFKGKCIIY